MAVSQATFFFLFDRRSMRAAPCAIALATFSATTFTAAATFTATAFTATFAAKRPC